TFTQCLIAKSRPAAHTPLAVPTDRRGSGAKSVRPPAPKPSRFRVRTGPTSSSTVIGAGLGGHLQSRPHLVADPLLDFPSHSLVVWERQQVSVPDFQVGAGAVELHGILPAPLAVATDPADHANLAAGCLPEFSGDAAGQHQDLVR